LSFSEIRRYYEEKRMVIYQNATIMRLNETAFTYLTQGDILSAFWKVMTEQWGMFIYILIIFMTDIAIVNKSKSASAAVIINILLLVLFQNFIIEAVQKIMFIITALILTVAIWGIYTNMRNIEE